MQYTGYCLKTRIVYHQLNMSISPGIRPFCAFEPRHGGSVHGDTKIDIPGRVGLYRGGTPNSLHGSKKGTSQSKIDDYNGVPPF